MSWQTRGTCTCRKQCPGGTAGQAVPPAGVQLGPQGLEPQVLAQSQQQSKASCRPAEAGCNGSNEQRGFKLK